MIKLSLIEKSLNICSVVKQYSAVITHNKSNSKWWYYTYIMIGSGEIGIIIEKDEYSLFSIDCSCCIIQYLYLSLYYKTSDQ